MDLLTKETEKTKLVHEGQLYQLPFFIYLFYPLCTCQKGHPLGMWSPLRLSVATSFNFSVFYLVNVTHTQVHARIESAISHMKYSALTDDFSESAEI